jgi:hypothetical protein
MRQTAAMVALAMVLAVLVSSAAWAQEKSMLEKASAEDQKLFAELKPLILKEAAQKPLVLAESAESYFWVMSARMVPLLKAYSYSKDPAFLEAYVPLQEHVLSQRYLHPTKPEWSGWWTYKGSDETSALIDHDTIVFFVPALMFVKEVRSDAKLKEKYGAKAEAWLKDVETGIRNWDKRGSWHDLGDKGGWYTNVAFIPNEKTGELVPRSSVHGGGTTPYNKPHALFEALELAWQITGDAWYRDRMANCEKFFVAHWRVDDKHVEWNYRDHAFPGDYVSGVVGQGKTKTGAFVHYKGGYYALDVEGAVRAYDAGAFIERKHIEQFLKTNLEFMFLGDEKDPKFKMINGQYKPEEKYYKGYLWTSLAHFSPKVRELWKTTVAQAREKKGWMWWDNALNYLIETSQPVSWEPRYAKPGAKPAETKPAAK